MNTMTPLKNLVRFHYGSALKETARDDQGPFTVFGSNGPVGRHSQRLVDFPTIIIGRKGAAGSVYFAAEGGWPIDTTYYTEIIDKKRLYLRYLYYALNQAGLQNRTITTSIPGLNRDSLYCTPVLVPMFSEQKRIADILDKADAIRRKRRQASAIPKKAMESTFFSLFGDATKNEKGWQSGHLEDLCEKIVDCPHSTPNYSASSTGFYCVRSNDIQDGEIILGSTREVSHQVFEERIARHRPKPGEVVFSREGGRLGNAAQIPPGISVCLGQRMMLFTSKATAGTNEFIWALLNSPGIQRQLQAKTAGAAAPRVNIGDIRLLNVAIPPLRLQDLFSRLVTTIRGQRKLYIRSLMEADHLFNALVQRAFRGEL